MPPDDLAAWIHELRRRPDRGELAELPPIDLGNALALTDGVPAVCVLLVETLRRL